MEDAVWGKLYIVKRFSDKKYLGGAKTYLTNPGVFSFKFPARALLTGKIISTLDFTAAKNLLGLRLKLKLDFPMHANTDWVGIRVHIEQISTII